MLRRTAGRDRMIGLFILAAILFNPPILNLFGGTFYNWPVLYLYLFGAWAIIIIAVAVVVERDDGGSDGS